MIGAVTKKGNCGIQGLGCKVSFLPAFFFVFFLFFLFFFSFFFFSCEVPPTTLILPYPSLIPLILNDSHLIHHLSTSKFQILLCSCESLPIPALHSTSTSPSSCSCSCSCSCSFCCSSSPFFSYPYRFLILF